MASGAATPGGNEDFAIAPETDRWNGMLKLDVNLGPRQRLLVQGNRSDEDDSGEISSPVLGTIALPSAASTITGHRELGHRAPHRGPLRLHVPGELGLVPEGRGGAPISTARAASSRSSSCSPSGFQQTGAPFNGKQDRTSQRFQLAQSFTWNP